ncbi:hypothetical protein [uncultured Anaerococcus sp.]|uniref:hypothetical protein n=1 Tax=uncultured Anaerococcus sp. TaxID=293428 RepID=UPI00288B85B6|nr:hypothetical protein [uncultured Anaerococcus sp.]
MKGINEFVSLGARQKEIELEATIQGKKVKGNFLVKFPSIMDRIEAEAKASRILNQADVNTMLTETYILTQAICYLERVIINKPDWYNFDYIDDPQVIFDLYEKAKEFENSFRAKDESDEHQGDSSESVDEESLEDK